MIRSVYVVTAHRWGFAESHNYVVCVTDDLELAESLAKLHVEGRTGKYDCLVQRINVNWNRKESVCTYRGLGFHDRVAGSELEQSPLTLRQHVLAMLRWSVESRWRRFKQILNHRK